MSGASLGSTDGDIFFILSLSLSFCPPTYFLFLSPSLLHICCQIKPTLLTLAIWSHLHLNSGRGTPNSFNNWILITLITRS